MSRPICIGLTCGDPKGVGPELCVAALQRWSGSGEVVLRVFGESRVRGDVSDIDAGRMSAAAVAAAVAAAQRGEIDAIVTAPIAKWRWALAGITVPGHTEYLAQLVAPADPPATRMLFCAGALRIAFVTMHLPLQAVPAAITAESLRTTVVITETFLREHFGIAAPRLACLGLNPHAGEAGRLGDEEERIIRPTLTALEAHGSRIAGPFAADGFFGRQRSAYDGIIALYHDQGLIPIKTLAPTTAVNVTMGLPWLRVSPGHGTAEDLAGTDRVDPTNFFAAIDLAITLTQRKGRT